MSVASEVLAAPSPCNVGVEVNWSNPSPTKILRLDLYEDTIYEVFNSLDDAYEFVANIGSYKYGAVGSKGYIKRGMKRRDGRYLDYRWVTEYDFVHGNYEPLVKVAIPKGDQIVQMFVHSNEVVNTFSSLQVVCKLTGLSALCIRTGILNRNGFAGGYRWALKSRITKGIFPFPADYKKVRVQGYNQPQGIDSDAVVVYDRKGVLVDVVPSYEDARERFRLDGLAEITLQEMGTLPRGSNILMTYSMYLNKQLIKERNNPFNERYIVEVSIDGKIVREFKTLSTLARVLGKTSKECRGIIGTKTMGSWWMYKSDYYRSVMKN